MKTLLAADRLGKDLRYLKSHQNNDKLLIVIAAAYLNSVDQWSQQCELFGMPHINTNNLSPTERSNKINMLTESMKSGDLDRGCVVTTGTIIQHTEFFKLIDKKIPVLLIADNPLIFRKAFIKDDLQFIDYRLGLITSLALRALRYWETKECVYL